MTTTVVGALFASAAAHFMLRAMGGVVFGVDALTPNRVRQSSPWRS
jgi:hypothetical protein